MIDFKGINSREEKAWHELFSLFYAPLCVYVERWTESHDDAEDIVQDSLMKVWSSDATFDNEGQMSYYLYRTVYNNMVSSRRRSRNIHHADITDLADLFPEEAYTSAVREELYRKLYVAINALPPQQRRIMEMSIEGKSGKEIADMLSISVNTVKAHKRKAMGYLRKSAKSELLVLLLLMG